MARTNTLGNFLTDVATAIREKKGTTDAILASNFDTEIASIESGVDINEYFSDTITKGDSSSGGWTKTIIKLRSPLTIEGTDATYMFTRCLLNELPQIDTSSVTNMSNMFTGCHNLTTIPQLDTSSVTNMSNMFTGCGSLTIIPLIDTSSVTNMSNMFCNCNSLATIPQIDTSSVTNMAHMFSGCINLATIPQLDTSSVTNITYMFSDCAHLATIPQLDGGKLISVAYTFNNCKSLENFNGIINLGQAYLTTQSANYSNYRLVLSSSTKLTEQSIINILNNLYDIKTKGCNAQQVILGETNLAKLTSTEGQQALSSATEKGWSIS